MEMADGINFHFLTDRKALFKNSVVILSEMSILFLQFIYYWLNWSSVEGERHELIRHLEKIILQVKRCIIKYQFIGACSLNI